MITSILLATTILAFEPKFAQSGTEYAFLGFGSEEKPKVEDEKGDAESAQVQFAAMPDGKVRVAFVFDGTPIYRKEQGEHSLTLHFTSPISYNQRSVTSDVAEVVKSVKKISPTGSNLKLRVNFSENYSATFSDLGNKLRLELTPKAGVKPVKDDKLAKAEADKKAAEEKKLAEKKLAAIKLVEKKQQEKKVAAEKKKEKKEEIKLAEPLSPKIEEPKKIEEAKKPEPKQEAPKEPEVAEIFKLPDAPAAEKEITMPTAAATAAAEFKIEDGVEQLRFDFTQNAPAAIFERFGYLYAVFDTTEQIKMPSLKTSQIYNEAEKIKSDALIYKLPLKDKTKFNVYKVDNSWYIDSSLGQKNIVEKPLRAQVLADNWIINAATKKSYIKFRDDWTEDDLIVVPVFNANAANVNQQQNSDFINTATLQGIVLKPISATPYKMLFEGDDIKIKMSAPADKGLAKKTASLGLLPVYPFQNWVQLTGEKYREENAKAQAAGKIEYAQFLFSQGLYTDAVVRLKGFDSPTANFLRGAANFMAGRYNEAALAFDGVNIEAGQDNNELLLWKIAANQMLGRTNPQGVIMPDSSRFSLPENIKNYPAPIAARVLTAVAEYFVDSAQNSNAVDAGVALRKLNLTPAQKSYVDYLEGKIFAADNKKARAYEIWNKVAAADTDRESRAKATYEIIKNDIETKKIKDDVAAARLDKLLVVWKGDIFEYKLLTHLGDLYSKENKQLKALRVYKQAITKFDNFPENARMTEAMKLLFAEALKSETDEKTKIFDNLTAYYEFKELLPVGAEGDDIIMNLVDKLARYDLFTEAAELLESHVQSVTDNKKKAEISTKAAIFYFMNRNPQKALDILKASDSYGIPDYLKEERVLIATRSLVDIGELEAAIIAAGGLEEGQRNRIKAEVYWKQSKWDKLIEAYKNIEEKTPDDVLKLAIANSISGNKTALKLMRGQYSEMMAKTGHAKEFDYVTNTENINYRDLSGTLNVDLTAELIKKFKEKLKANGSVGLVAPAVSKTPAKTAAKPLPKK